MAQHTAPFTHLKQRVDSIFQSHQGDFAVAWYDLSTGDSLLVNEKESFHAASTMKTPVMMEVFRQAAIHRFSLDDSIDVVNSFLSIVDGSRYILSISDDSDDGIYSKINSKQTIQFLVEQMITVSSNLATNILIQKVGPDNVMKTMRELGLIDMAVLRGVEDGKAYAAGKNNTTTAYDLMLLYRHLAQGTTVSKDACSAMVKILRNQRFNEMIPALLPSEVAVAHKTGSITNVQHDSGIVYLPDGRSYVLVLLSKNLRSNTEGIEILASVSKEIYDFVTR